MSSSTTALTLWKGEICKRCYRRNCVGFNVGEEIWRAVVQDRFNLVCTTCFDELAEEAGVEYSFGEVFAISWSDWGGWGNDFERVKEKENR